MVPIDDTLITNTTPPDSLNIDSTTTAISIDTLTSPDALESPIKYVAKDSIRIDMKSKMVYLFGQSEVYYEEIDL